MKVVLHGTRGSVGRAGSETVRYGGDTSSVEVLAAGGEVLILDAGSGVVHAAASRRTTGRIDVLITHLHMDHIQGLGFFRPLFDPSVEVHLWGPASTTAGLAARLSRYLSPPLFPVRLRDLPNLHVHDLGAGSFEVGPFRVDCDYVIHPGVTLGYRVGLDGRTLAYIPDHEPALGGPLIDPAWTSGYDLARRADLLIHDAQYTDDEYKARVGWGHSTMDHCLAFARLAKVRRLVTFHHEPDHSDELIDRIHAGAVARGGLDFDLLPGLAGATFEV